MSFLGIQRIKKTTAENHDIISWLLCIFLGGTINIGILNAAYSYYLQNLPSISDLYRIIITVSYILFAILLPFILSLILTGIQPELRIVPPFYITAISWAWMFVLWINPNNASTMITPTILIGMFYVALGIAEDKLTTAILGIAIERRNIYFEHLRVYATIDEVKDRLTIPEIRRSLYLSDRVEGNAEKGYTFKTKGGYVFINRILIIKDKDFPELTSLKIAFYEKRSYSLKVSPSFIEESHKTLWYLKDVFIGHEPEIGLEVILPFTNSTSDILIDNVVDDLRGYYVKSKQFSIRDRLTIASLVGILALTIVLFLIEQPIYAGLSIAIEVLLAVLQLPDLIRKQRE